MAARPLHGRHCRAIWQSCSAATNESPSARHNSDLSKAGLIIKPANRRPRRFFVRFRRGHRQSPLNNPLRPECIAVGANAQQLPASYCVDPPLSDSLFFLTEDSPFTAEANNVCAKTGHSVKDRRFQLLTRSAKSFQSHKPVAGRLSGAGLFVRLFSRRIFAAIARLRVRFAIGMKRREPR